jgi:hypothetical protein
MGMHGQMDVLSFIHEKWQVNFMSTPIVISKCNIYRLILWWAVICVIIFFCIFYIYYKIINLYQMEASSKGKNRRGRRSGERLLWGWYNLLACYDYYGGAWLDILGFRILLRIVMKSISFCCCFCFVSSLVCVAG